MEEPEIGMGATICYLSDRVACTIIDVSPSLKTLLLQEDKVRRTDNNGMSDCQEYAYSSNPDGAIHQVTLRKDGSYRVSNSKRYVRIGVREHFYDYSF